MADIKKYYVKGTWIENMESMSDKLWCIRYDAEEGRLQFPIKIADTMVYDVDDIDSLRNEAEDLTWAAKCGKVTGRQYGRIKAMVAWRVAVRYSVCMASGMSESEAGRCFEDM